MKKILFIEENNTTFKLISRFLEDIGYPEALVIRATNLNDIPQIREEEIELVLADLSFAQGEASDVYEQLQHRFRLAPIIILAGNEETGFAAHAMQAGAQEILVKGDFDRKLLSKAIRYAVEGKKMYTNYQRLFHESPVPMYVFDIHDYRFLDVNIAALTGYGYAREEFLAMTATDIRPQEDVQAFLNINSVMPDSYFDAGRWRHLRKDGSVFYVHIYSHETAFEGKRARVVLALDIDNKVKAEQALQRKARQVENILESITDGFYTLDEEWRFTYLNTEFLKLLHRTREDLLGKVLWEEFPELKSLRFNEEYHKASRGKTSVHFEEYYAPLGIWLQVNAYPAGGGLAVYVQDITDKKSSEERLIRNKENLRAIINNTKDIVWSIDRNNQIISANQAFWERVYQLTGKEKDVVANKDFDPSIFEAWSTNFKRAFLGESFKTVWEEGTEDNRTYEEVSYNPIYNEQHEVIGVSCFSRDITEHRKYQRMIEEQNEQLRKIAWVQSHEVRSPVATILGLVQLFNTSDLLDPMNADIITKIKEAAQSLDKVTHKITEYTSIAPGNKK